jgi:peptidoglycan/LPS O-acetylase OafA/YrhL
MCGGFIGVDIFFVISGFLISGIIIKQTKKNKFSYYDFYSRRVKRIYPALILVLSFVLIFSCWKYMEKDLYNVSKAIAASTVFGANIEILTYSRGYFDSDIKSKPLLHLWSLGV